MFLGTLLRNNKTVVQFKKKIIQQFKKFRIELEAFQRYKKQPKYRITREAGKIVRKQATKVELFAELHGESEVISKDLAIE